MPKASSGEGAGHATRKMPFACATSPVDARPSIWATHAAMRAVAAFRPTMRMKSMRFLASAFLTAAIAPVFALGVSAADMGKTLP